MDPTTDISAEVKDITLNESLSNESTTESPVEVLDEKETIIEAPKLDKDIPISVPYRINANITNPLEKCDIQSFSFKDAVHTENGDILYKFPHSDGIYWTNFKYSASTLDENLPSSLSISVVIVTSDNETYEISLANDRKINEWYDTEWALPSINIPDSKYGFYLKIKPVSADSLIYDLNITILGFKELYTTSNYYMLFSPAGTYNFIVIQDEDADGKQNASIYNLKKYAKIHYIVHKLVNIKRIKHY